MQISGKVILGENVSSTQAATRWEGGKGFFIAEATWGGGSVSLYIVSPHGTAVPLRDVAGNAVTLSANGSYPFDAPPGQILVSVTTASAVYAYAVGSHQ